MKVMLWDKKRKQHLLLRDAKYLDVSHAGKYYQINMDLYSFEDYRLESVTSK